MSRLDIGLGTVANDGTGDPLRSALNKVNSNFLYTFVQGWKGSYPPGSVITLVGDSTYDDTGGKGVGPAISKQWLSKGGIFQGCDVRNLGANGSEINNWVSTIPHDPSTPNNLKGEVWAVVNTNPDLILICLGRNDVLLAARRAAEGQPITMQNNFNTLVGFFLEKCPQADILLHMPGPFTGPTSATGANPAKFTDFVDADEAALYSLQMRDTYNNCAYLNNPRIRLFDSLSYAPARVDDWNTWVDPETGTTLMQDDTHPSFIGQQRLMRDVGNCALGCRVAEFVSIKPSFVEAVDNAKWNINARCVNVTVIESGSTLLDFALDPLVIVDSHVNVGRDYTRSVADNATPHLPALRALSPYGRFNQLLQAGGQGTGRKLMMGFYDTGNIYSCSKAVYVQTVEGAQRYIQLRFDNHYTYDGVTPTDFSVEDVGQVVFWTEDDEYNPWISRNAQLHSEVYFANNPAGWNNPAPTAIIIDSMTGKQLFDWTEVKFSGSAYVAPSGGSCTVQLWKNDVGQFPGGMNWADGSKEATTPGFASVDLLTGTEWYLEVTLNGGNAKNLKIVMEGYKVLKRD